LRPGTGASDGKLEHQQSWSPASMPQLNGALQRAQRDSRGFVSIPGKIPHRKAQGSKLGTEIAAAIADRKMHAQRDPLAEAELAVFAL
jgi:hypothetical protein